MNISKLTIGLLIAVATSSAYAQPLVQWSAAASSCSILNASTDYYEYGGIVYGYSGKVIYLTCPIHHEFVTTPTYISLTSQGNSSTKGSSSASLRYVNKSDGYDYAVSGASTSRTASTYGSNSASFSHTFDFDDHYYYVQIVLDGSSGGASTQAAWGVELGVPLH